MALIAIDKSEDFAHAKDGTNVYHRVALQGTRAEIVAELNATSRKYKFVRWRFDQSYAVIGADILATDPADWATDFPQ